MQPAVLDNAVQEINVARDVAQHEKVLNVHGFDVHCNTSV
jgi:hypothetical protein